MNEKLVVLIVEDDEDDLYLLEREFERIGSPLIKHAGDGGVAIKYLAGSGPFADRATHPLPDVVLLDLKIPFLDGHGVLAWIRARSELAGLRVYILTGSDEPKDRAQATALGATGYFVKPLRAEKLKNLFPELLPPTG